MQGLGESSGGDGFSAEVANAGRQLRLILAPPSGNELGISRQLLLPIGASKARSTSSHLNSLHSMRRRGGGDLAQDGERPRIRRQARGGPCGGQADGWIFIADCAARERKEVGSAEFA